VSCSDCKHRLGSRLLVFAWQMQFRRRLMLHQLQQSTTKCMTSWSHSDRFLCYLTFLRTDFLRRFRCCYYHRCCYYCRQCTMNRRNRSTRAASLVYGAWSNPDNHTVCDIFGLLDELFRHPQNVHHDVPNTFVTVSSATDSDVDCMGPRWMSG
jgi:hypothetical protein